MFKNLNLKIKIHCNCSNNLILKIKVEINKSIYIIIQNKFLINPAKNKITLLILVKVIFQPKIIIPILI